MSFNPVDTKIQDVIVVHAGLYLGATNSSSGLKINATDLPNIKGGMFAAMNSSGELELCDGDTQVPVAMFYGDGSRPKSLTALMRGGVYGVKNWTTSDIANFTAGAELIVTTTGKLLSKGVSTNHVVAIVLHPPASASDYVYIKLLV